MDETISKLTKVLIFFLYSDIIDFLLSNQTYINPLQRSDLVVY